MRSVELPAHLDVMDERDDAPHVLVVVQNLPVPLDRRVWLECKALRASGYAVSVICPRGPGDPGKQVLDGIHLYKYRPAPEARGLVGFALEFTYSWVRTAKLSVDVWRRRPFQVLQACNPPDTYWALAALWRLGGVAFVFDHHDLNPELFLSRFGEPESMLQKVELAGLRWLERMTHRTADKIISTNSSYRAIAIGRGHRDPTDVTVVRSGPDTRQMRPVYPPAGRVKRRTFTLVYLGIMGPQDGVDTVLDVMAELVQRRRRQDVQAVLLGFGDCFDELTSRCTRMGLDPYVTFTGRADRRAIAEQLSAADVGLCPDPKTPLNDVSTMNKTMEYMAYALPTVSFDLVETRVSGGSSVIYVPSGDVNGFADAVEQLLDDPTLRTDLGRRARRRVATELDWRPQARAYVEVFDELIRSEGGRRHRSPSEETDHPLVTDEAVDPALADPSGTDEFGHRYVPLDDDEFDRYIRDRTAP